MLLAFILALVIGLSLGMLGSGGSVLTIPLLVYLFDHSEKVAVAEALAIVGMVSLLGAIPYAFRREIDWRMALFFGVPGMIGAFMGGCCSNFMTGSFQLILFAFTMLGIASLLLFGPASFDSLIPGKGSKWLTLSKGFFIGVLTGLLGVGGGFLIVPSLILLCGLPIVGAVGTSLVIIAMNSFIGFGERLLNLHLGNMSVDWQLISIIAAIEILGCLAGGYYAKNVPQAKLRKILGVCIFVMGSGILLEHL